MTMDATAHPENKMMNNLGNIKDGDIVIINGWTRVVVVPADEPWGITFRAPNDLESGRVMTQMQRDSRERLKASGVSCYR
jgi:hypothetical protein